MHRLRVEIKMFAQAHKEYLQKYIPLTNGVSSHDTIQRVKGLISPEVLQQLYSKWQELLNSKEGEKIKKNRADYVLALNRNQKNLYEVAKEYFSDKEFL